MDCQNFKEAVVLPRRLPNFAKASSFIILTIKLSYFLNHVWITFRLVQFGASAIAKPTGKIVFYLVNLTLFTIISMETRNMRGVFIHIV